MGRQAVQKHQGGSKWIPQHAQRQQLKWNGVFQRWVWKDRHRDAVLKTVGHFRTPHVSVHLENSFRGQGFLQKMNTWVLYTHSLQERPALPASWKDILRWIHDSYIWRAQAGLMVPDPIYLGSWQCPQLVTRWELFPDVFRPTTYSVTCTIKPSKWASQNWDILWV